MGDSKMQGAPLLGCDQCDATAEDLDALKDHRRQCHDAAHDGDMEAWRVAASAWEVIYVNPKTRQSGSLKSIVHLCADAGKLGNYGDPIIWITQRHEQPIHPFVDALYDAEHHPLPDEQAQQAVCLILAARTLLQHLVEPSNIISESTVHTGGHLALESVFDLLRYVCKRTLFKSAATEAIAAAVLTSMQVYCPDAHDEELRWETESGGPFGHIDRSKVYSLVWKTLTPNLIRPMGDLGKVAGRTDVLVYALTCKAAKVPVPVVNGELASLRRVLKKPRYYGLRAGELEASAETARLHHTMIAEDLAVEPDSIEYRHALVYGMPANARWPLPAVPDIVSCADPVLTWNSHRPLFDPHCDGRIDGKEIVISVTGHDGLLVDDQTLIQFFRNWKHGFLVISYLNKIPDGIRSPYKAAGRNRNIWLSIPDFCFYLRDRGHQRNIERARLGFKSALPGIESDWVQQKVNQRQAEADANRESFGRDLDAAENAHYANVAQKMDYLKQILDRADWDDGEEDFF